MVQPARDLLPALNARFVALHGECPYTLSDEEWRTLSMMALDSYGLKPPLFVLGHRKDDTALAISAAQSKNASIWRIVAPSRPSEIRIILFSKLPEPEGEGNLIDKVVQLLRGYVRPQYAHLQRRIYDRQAMPLMIPTS